MKIPWLILLGCLSLSACASAPKKPTLIDHSISKAFTESDQLDGKAVLVESWLRSH